MAQNQDVTTDPQIGGKHILFQDNKAAIKLAKRGRVACSKQTRHIDIKYFFVTDKIAQGELSVEYCPTKSMVGDMFIKLLQEELFHKFRNTILGIDDDIVRKYEGDYKLKVEGNADLLPYSKLG